MEEVNQDQTIQEQAPAEQVKPKSSLLRRLRKIGIILFSFLIFLIFAYMFLAMPRKTIGKPIKPFYYGQTMLAEKVSYLFTDPKEGDRVLFKADDTRMDFFGVITAIENKNNILTYKIVSSDPINPWVVTRDKIIGKIYYPFMKNEQVLKIISSQLPTPPLIPSPSQNSNSSDIWKTFTNEKYKFSFKYPNEIIIKDDYIDSSGQLLFQTYKDKSSKSYKDIKFQVSLSISRLNLKSLEDFVRNQTELIEKDYKIDLANTQEININGIKGLKGEGIIKGERVSQVWLEDKGLMFIFSYNPESTENKELFDQILSTFKFTSTESTSIPSDWTLKSDTACNVVFPIPPKKAPYYTPDDPNTYSDLAEDGAFWQFQENNEGSSLFAYYKRVLFHNPKAGGSGYIPGLVSISCSTNENKYTNDILLERYKKTFEAASSEIEVSETKELNLWGRKVYAVYVKGGMFDENNPTYLFATDKHIYSVSKIAMSSNSFVKETAETIFNNLNFKD